MPKVAVFYFDKLYILDSFMAVSGGDEFVQDPDFQDEIVKYVRLLQSERVRRLKMISHAEDLNKHKVEITVAIRNILYDLKYIMVCISSIQHHSWRLSRSCCRGSFSKEKLDF